MSIDGWKFAEQLVGITDEALRQRRKALEGKLGAHTDAVWEGVKATKEEVSKRLRDMLYPGPAQPNLDLDGFLDEVDARLNRNTPPLGNPPPNIVRDAALEEAVSAIPLTLPTGEYTETMERIRALKSKPAPGTWQTVGVDIGSKPVRSAWQCGCGASGTGEDLSHIPGPHRVTEAAVAKAEAPPYAKRSAGHVDLRNQSESKRLQDLTQGSTIRIWPHENPDRVLLMDCRPDSPWKGKTLFEPVTALVQEASYALSGGYLAALYDSRAKEAK